MGFGALNTYSNNSLKIIYLVHQLEVVETARLGNTGFGELANTVTMRSSAMYNNLSKTWHAYIAAPVF